MRPTKLYIDMPSNLPAHDRRMNPIEPRPKKECGEDEEISPQVARLDEVRRRALPDRFAIANDAEHDDERRTVRKDSTKCSQVGERSTRRCDVGDIDALTEAIDVAAFQARVRVVAPPREHET